MGEIHFVLFNEPLTEVQIMIIDEQIAGLNKLLAKEKMQLVRQGAKQLSPRYNTLLGERDALVHIRSEKGGTYEMDLSVSLSVMASDIKMQVDRAPSLDSVDTTKKGSRVAEALSFLARAQGKAGTVPMNDAQTAVQIGHYSTYA